MESHPCPNCGTPNRPGAKFCVSCGVLLGGAASRDGHPEVGQASLPHGTLLNGRYRIDRELGRGGFGAVYSAWDTSLNRACAVKENFSASPDAQRQFAREATILANLSHPNLPRVTDHFTVAEKNQYLVMDFIEGEDLFEMQLRSGLLPIEKALLWIMQVADALTYLHSRQPAVVHRDIKPSNIRITPAGQAVLVDFGLVKVATPHKKTTVGARAVTPGYAPPEQYGQGSTDPRSDIYALGATLYNVLTEKEPLESVQRMAGAAMQSARQANPQVPEHVSQAIQKAMEINPSRRFQSASEFKAALQGNRVAPTAVFSPVKATPATQVAPAPFQTGLPVKSTASAIPAKKSRSLFLGAGAGVVGVICLGLAALLFIVVIYPGLATSQPTPTHTQSPTADASQTLIALQTVQVSQTAFSLQATLTAAPIILTDTPLVPPSAIPRPFRVLFSSNGPQNSQFTNLYILEADGSITQLTNETSNNFGRALSPDGTQLAFTSDRSGNWQIYILDLVNMTTRRITDLPDQARHPVWSPDGMSIAFNSFPSPTSSLIWTMGSDGSDPRHLVESAPSGRPSWSPDGTSVAFNGGRVDSNGDGVIDTADMWDIFMIINGTPGEKNLTNTPDFTEIAPAWSPDGRIIVFSSVRSDTNQDGSITLDDNGEICMLEIALVDPAGAGITCLTNTPNLSEGEPFWTLDGSQILYVVYGDNSNALWIMGADGSAPRLLLENYGSAFSPVQIP